jgi:hypothetical protein
MENFNYDSAADVFSSDGRRMSYRRFSTGAEAVRFVIEDMDAVLLRHAFIETDEARCGEADIRALYEADDYPLPRRCSALASA